MKTTILFIVTAFSITSCSESTTTRSPRNRTTTKNQGSGQGTTPDKGTSDSSPDPVDPTDQVDPADPADPVVNVPNPPEDPKPTETCNHQMSNIIGGALARENGYAIRSTVSLNENKRSFCTGIIIGPNHIVTAAHCLDEISPSRVEIGFGIKGETKSDLKVTNVAIHPKYSSGSRPNQPYYDIGVIVFSGSLPPGYEAVDIAPVTFSSTTENVLLAGYGITSDNESSSTPARLHEVETTVQTYLKKQMEFELKEGTGRGSCSGDSGGPLFVKVKGAPTRPNACLQVMGAVSRGPSSCDPGNGIYTDVRLFQGWMACNFSSFGKPLTKLIDDASNVDCPR